MLTVNIPEALQLPKGLRGQKSSTESLISQNRSNFLLQHLQEEEKLMLSHGTVLDERTKTCNVSCLKAG